MKKKIDIGDYLSFELKDWKFAVKGFLVGYNDEWTVLLSNPRDYIIDGYIVFRNKYAPEYSISEEELLTEKILRLKGIPDIKSLSIPIDDLKTILTYATNKFGAFGVYRKAEDTIYIGKLKSLDSKQLIINWLDLMGKWSGTYTLKSGDIRVIEFNTDYINSLVLFSNRKVK